VSCTRTSTPLAIVTELFDSGVETVSLTDAYNNVGTYKLCCLYEG